MILFMETKLKNGSCLKAWNWDGRLCQSSWELADFATRMDLITFNSGESRCSYKVQNDLFFLNLFPFPKLLFWAYKGHFTFNQEFF